MGKCCSWKRREELSGSWLNWLVAGICFYSGQEPSLISFSIRQDPCLDYWLSQCMLLCFLTQPHPLKHSVACRLLLKPVCSSADCQSFPAPVVPIFHPFSLASRALGGVYSLQILTGSLWRLKQRRGLKKENAQGSEVYLCLPSESLFSLFS